MSEHQYYEFQAVDRPLTNAEMVELRAISSRAQISPTRFQNVYNFGSFQGDPRALMERYFDGFVHVANWGTHWLMLRLPRQAVDVELARRYCVDEGATLHVQRDQVLLELRSDDEAGAGWVEDEEAESWLPSLLPLRAELARGDRRALYLAWLAAAGSGLLDDAVVEPPLPAGLGALSAALEALAAFLRVDRDLLAVAAEQSPAAPPPGASAALDRWVRALPESEKNDILLRLAHGEAGYVQAELLRRFDGATGRGAAARGERTVGALLAGASERADARQR